MEPGDRQRWSAATLVGEEDDALERGEDGSRWLAEAAQRRYLALKRWLPAILIAGLAVLFYRSADAKTVAAGVAVFLFGMAFLEEGFTAFTGGFLERILDWSTNRLWKCLAFGVVTTSLMQSSSLVTVITISFLSAGLIGLFAGIGIVFGANIGTTTGAWLMAALGVKIQLSGYAMPLLVFGLILGLHERKSLRGAGRILAGLGFLFLGIQYMKDGFEAYQGSLDLSALVVPGIAGLVVLTGLGVLATVVMQSSHATLMLIIAALAAGQIDYDGALALAIGANIGTTITAILGSLGSNVAGRRLAIAHLVFNTATAILAIVFIGQFRWAVDHVAEFAGIAGDDWTLKLAVFHTLFNVAGVLVMLPFTSALTRGLERFVTSSGRGDGGSERPLYLNEAALQYPDTAIEVLRKETNHLFDNAFEILAHALNMHRRDILSDRRLEAIVHGPTSFEIDVMPMYYRRIKVLYNEIVAAATRVRSQLPLTEAQSQHVHDVRVVCRSIAELVRDVSQVRENLTRYGSSSNADIREEYNQFRYGVARTLRQANRIRATDDEALAARLLQALTEEIDESDVLVNGALDRLIRGGLITSQMATSLMNDSAYVSDIRRRIIEVCERLFLAEDVDLKAFEQPLEEGPSAASETAGRS